MSIKSEKPSKQSTSEVQKKKVKVSKNTKANGELAKTLGILQKKNFLKKKEKKKADEVENDFTNLIKSLVSERQFFFDNKMYRLECIKFLRTWNTNRNLWAKHYPTANWKLAQQKMLLSICLNEFKMTRPLFKLMLQHFKEQKSDEVQNLLKELLKGAENCRQLWQCALSKHPEVKDDLTVSLLTCVRPVSKETIMRMRKIQELIDPEFFNVAPAVTEKPKKVSKNTMSKKLKRLVKKSVRFENK